MEPRFPPISQSEPVAVRIAEAILERIRGGQLPIGARLPAESELARQFEVSRPTIREALGALQFAGYIESGRGSRKQIVADEARTAVPVAGKMDSSPAAIISLLEARLLIEPQVAALAALRPDQEALERATTLVRGMQIAAAEPALHARTDLRVHRAIVDICPNRILAETALQLIDMAADPVLQRARERAWSDPQLPHVWTGHHQELLDAVRARDPERASAASWRHLASASQNVLTALEIVEPEGFSTDILGFDASTHIRSVIDRLSPIDAVSKWSVESS